MDHNQEACLIHSDLGIVTLIYSLISAVFHNPRVRVGEIVPILVMGAGFWWLGWASTRLALVAGGLLFAPMDFGLVLSLFFLISLLCTGFQYRLGLRQILDPLLPQADFIPNDQSSWRDQFALICLINDLLSAESDDASLDLLRSRQPEINENLLAIMEELAAQLREAGNESGAQRLEILLGEAQQLLPSSS